MLSECGQCGQTDKTSFRLLCRLERDGGKVIYPSTGYLLPNCRICSDCVASINETERLKGSVIKAELERGRRSIYILTDPDHLQDFVYVRESIVLERFANAIPLLDRMAWSLAQRKRHVA